jgi:phosphoribosylglycinamide formyltransferase-1
MKNSPNKTNLSIFASGSGTNAENIARYFSNHETIKVKSLYTNNPKANVIERIKPYGIEARIFNREEFYKSDSIINELKQQGIDYIILAGFLWLVPQDLIEAFPNRIINIHPALLPKYGGKGMYGNKVHEAVVENHDTETGITIHLVNTEYDKGERIFQSVVKLPPGVTKEEVAEKIHELEMRDFPKVIEGFIMKKINKTD